MTVPVLGASGMFSFHNEYRNILLSLSLIGRIQILTYLILGILDAAIFDCVIRSCDLFD